MTSTIINSIGEHVSIKQISENKIEVRGHVDPKFTIGNYGDTIAAKLSTDVDLYMGLNMKRFGLKGLIKNIEVHSETLVLNLM